MGRSGPLNSYLMLSLTKFVVCVRRRGVVCLFVFYLFIFWKYGYLLTTNEGDIIGSTLVIDMDINFLQRSVSNLGLAFILVICQCFESKISVCDRCTGMCVALPFPDLKALK